MSVVFPARPELSFIHERNDSKPCGNIAVHRASLDRSARGLRAAVGAIVLELLSDRDRISKRKSRVVNEGALLNFSWLRTDAIMTKMQRARRRSIAKKLPNGKARKITRGWVVMVIGTLILFAVIAENARTSGAESMVRHAARAEHQISK